MPKRPINSCPAYHAHLYFDQDTLDLAKQVSAKAGELFPIQVGRVHEKKVGPHPCWSCQLAFAAEAFEEIIPWLEQNRGAMDVFVHGLSGDALADHTTYAYWLGNEHKLKLEIFMSR